MIVVCVAEVWNERDALAIKYFYKRNKNKGRKSNIKTKPNWQQYGASKCIHIFLCLQPDIDINGTEMKGQF